MVKTTVKTRVNKDAAGALESSTRKYMLDGAQVGFNKAREEAPVGATGFLQGQAMMEPEIQSDGSVWWGNLARYAAAVEDGSVPHWIPLHAMEGLIRWSRRILGSDDAAWGVRHKIAEEGTDAQPFIEPGEDASKAWFASRGHNVYFEDRL